MEPLQIIASRIDYPEANAFSALPDAPVVQYRERRTVGLDSRRIVADALHRIADAVAPASPSRSAWASSR